MLCSREPTTYYWLSRTKSQRNETTSRLGAIIGLHARNLNGPWVDLCPCSGGINRDDHTTRGARSGNRGVGGGDSPEQYAAVGRATPRRSSGERRARRGDLHARRDAQWQHP